MLVYNNKEYRNLVEQVEKNKADIEDWNAKEDTLANFGIKIIGKVQSADQLPDVSDYDYGDAYMVGSDETADYNYYLATRPTAEVAEKHWQNIGKLSITGPEGPKGDEITSFLTTRTQEVDTGQTKYTHNTVTVTMSDGRQLTYVVTASAENGDKGDQGIQGIQGEKGDKGDKGDTGEQGPQGEMGPTAPAYHIVGTVTSTSQLPDPTLLKDLSAAYIVEENNVKKLYIQTGLSIEVAVWEYLGELTASNYWELSNKILAPLETVDTVQIKKLAVLNAGGLSCSSPNISGVASCSAIDSTTSLNLSATNGISLVHNNTTVAKTSTDGLALSKLVNNTTTHTCSVLVADSVTGVIGTIPSIAINASTGSINLKGISIIQPDVATRATSSTAYPTLSEVIMPTGIDNSTKVKVINCYPIYTSADDTTVPKYKNNVFTTYIDRRTADIVTSGEFVAGNLGYDNQQVVYGKNRITKKKYNGTTVTTMSYYFPSESGTLEIAGKYWLERCDITGNVCFYLKDSSNCGIRANLPEGCTITSISVSGKGASSDYTIDDFNFDQVTIKTNGSVDRKNDYFDINDSYTIEGVGHLETVLSDDDTYRYSLAIQDIKEDGTATYKLITSSSADANDYYTQVVLITFPSNTPIELTVEADEYTKANMIEK